MSNTKIKTIIETILELCTIALIWATIMLLIGMFSGCAGSSHINGPAKQQNLSASSSTVAQQSAIPVNQIDLNQDGLVDATEQTIISSNTPDTLLTFGVICAAVFLSVLICAWMANRTSRKDAINRAAADAMVETEDLIGQPSRPSHTPGGQHPHGS